MISGQNPPMMATYDRRTESSTDACASIIDGSTDVHGLRNGLNNSPMHIVASPFLVLYEVRVWLVHYVITYALLVFFFSSLHRPRRKCEARLWYKCEDQAVLTFPSICVPFSLFFFGSLFTYLPFLPSFLLFLFPSFLLSFFPSFLLSFLLSFLPSFLLCLSRFLPFLDVFFLFSLFLLFFPAFSFRLLHIFSFSPPLCFTV